MGYDGRMERKRITYRSVGPLLTGVAGLWILACFRLGLRDVIEGTAILVLAALAVFGWRAIGRW